MSTTNNHFGVETYNKGDVVVDRREYVKETGIYNVKVDELVGSVSKDGRTSFVTFKFITEDGRAIACKELKAYTKDGVVTPTKGDFMVKALLAFQAGKGKDKVSASWKKSVEKTRNGETYEVHKLDKVKGLELIIHATLERSIYEGQNGEVAKEEMKLTSVFTKDGESLGEFETGENAGTKLAQTKSRLADKLEKGISTIIYKDTDEEEWLEVKGDHSEANSSSSKEETSLDEDSNDTEEDVLPELPDDELDGDIKTEEPLNDEDL